MPAAKSRIGASKWIRSATRSVDPTAQSIQTATEVATRNELASLRRITLRCQSVAPSIIALEDPMAETHQNETNEDAMDSSLEALSTAAEAWRVTSLDTRIDMLERLIDATALHAERWVSHAVEAKGIDKGSPLTGEEWASGPWAFIVGCDHLQRTLETIREETSLLSGIKVRKSVTGQTIARVHPADIWERLLLNGVTAEVWMEPGVEPDELEDHMASGYRGERPEARVALVLGAGNIASIPPLDMLHKLFVEGQVCIVKMNPVNDYLGPIFADIFEEFVAHDYVAFAYGGVEVGKYLTTHERVDEIHITGSEATHDAIVYGTGEEGRERKKEDNPVNDRPISSELGGIGPTIVVPGPWLESDIEFQAEHVATQKMHNGGFNCIAAQVLIVSDAWEQKDAFLSAIEETMRSIEPREPYYPGALDRVSEAREDHENVVEFDESRILIRGLDANAEDEAFTEEFFSGALAQTSLSHRDPEEFLAAAIEFANEKLRGTLGANIIIHPETRSAMGPRFEELLGELKYGTIGVNAWSGVGFMLARASWGAYPGHPRNDIESGIGVVHNAMMFDKPQKTVVSAPFQRFPISLARGEATILPRPPWFVTNTESDEVMKRLTYFAADPSVGALPGIFAAALRG